MSLGAITQLSVAKTTEQAAVIAASLTRLYLLQTSVLFLHNACSYIGGIIAVYSTCTQTF